MPAAVMLKPVYDNPEKSASRRDALAALAAHLPIFTAPGFAFGAWIMPDRVGTGVTQMGWFEKSPEAQAFVKDAYDHGWVRDFDWSTWAQTPEADDLLRSPMVMAGASGEDLARVLTACIRGDRFVEGSLNRQFEDGLLTCILERATSLLAAEGAPAPNPASDHNDPEAGIADRPILSAGMRASYQAAIDTIEDEAAKAHAQELLAEASPESLELLDSIIIDMAPAEEDPDA